jgi:hypothetical protein
MRYFWLLIIIIGIIGRQKHVVDRVLARELKTRKGVSGERRDGQHTENADRGISDAIKEVRFELPFCPRVHKVDELRIRGKYAHVGKDNCLRFERGREHPNQGEDTAN